MAHIFKRTVALLNDLNNLDLVLKKSIEFSTKHQTILEILYIQEEALFEVPDYFLAEDKIAKEGIDKAKIKAKIEEHLKKLHQNEPHAIFVKEDDTVGQILHYGQEDKTVLFIGAYHESLTPKLLEQTPYSFWFIKNKDVIAYEKIVLPLDFQGESKKIIQATKHIFSDSEITLLHDYRYLVDTVMVQVDYLNIVPIITSDMVELNEVLKKEKQEILKTYTKEFELKGVCVEGEGALDEELIRYIGTHEFDLTVLYHRDTELFLSPSLIVVLLKKVDTDFFIFNL